MHTTDPYWKLRPAPPTPDDELCQCSQVTQLVLCDLLSSNPLHCLVCWGEVAPERIGFDGALAEAIAAWRGLHRALFGLWLDSGEYQLWAQERLKDPSGTVNVCGREIVRQLGRFTRTYFRWFQDTTADDYVPPTACPVCRGPLEPSPRADVRECETCAVLV